MDGFQKTLKILNSMIERLEANTGGEVKVGAKIEEVKPVQNSVENKQP